MIHTDFLRQPFIAWAVPLLLIAVIVGITYSPLFLLQPAALSFGITVDLLFTIPLVYLLLARQRDLPRWAAGSFFVAGVLVASLVLSDQHRHYLRLAKTWLLPGVELTVLVIVVHRARRIARHYRDHSDTSPDFYDALRQATTAVLPPGVAGVLTSEVAVLYYGFFARKKHALQPGEFSYHRKSGSVALLVTVMLLTVAEATVVHLLLTRWSTTAAWVLTGISVYTALQVFGVLRSMSRRPIVITDRHLQLRYGFLSETTIPLSAVASVKLATQPAKYDGLTRSLSPLGELEPHNVWLQLRDEGTLKRMYGVRRSFTTLVFHVDDAPRFVEVLRRTLTKTDSPALSSNASPRPSAALLRLYPLVVIELRERQTSALASESSPSFRCGNGPLPASRPLLRFRPAAGAKRGARRYIRQRRGTAKYR